MNKVKIYGKSGGLHMLLEPNNSMSEDELIETAKTKGVKVYPSSIFYAISSREISVKVLIDFANLDENL